MTNPSECKYCGCNKFNADSVSMTRFRCGSSYWPQDEMWQIANGCAAKCAVQLVELRERVQQAVEALDNITAADLFENFDALENATRILRGNAPEIPDRSPVTTDDLAASDYYEAVRQRVPWMVSVEHIEGLVEGYRRCGVPVWKTAEEIRKVHGGEHEQAD